MAPVIRSLTAADETAWNGLWHQYLLFYEHALPPEQTERTWRTLVSDTGPLFARVVEIDGELVGFAHFSFTHSTWEEHPDVYLEDLFVSPFARGLGIGRSLIDDVTRIAREHRASRVHWITKNDNAQARRLYDRLATLSDFVIYERSTAEPPGKPQT